MKKKKVAKLLALAMAGMMTLSGCGGTGGTDSNTDSDSQPETGSAANTDSETTSDEADSAEQTASGEKTVINFYYWDENQKGGMDELISLFEASQDEVVVESTIVPWGEYWTKLQTALPTGTGPDAMSLS